MMTRPHAPKRSHANPTTNPSPYRAPAPLSPAQAHAVRRANARLEIVVTWARAARDELLAIGHPDATELAEMTALGASLLDAVTREIVETLESDDTRGDTVSPRDTSSGTHGAPK